MSKKSPTNPAASTGLAITTIGSLILCDEIILRFRVRILVLYIL